MNDSLMSSMANLIANSIIETQCKIGMDTIENSGLRKEFDEFYKKSKHLHLFDAMKEFGKLHQDKFYVISEEEQYQNSKTILIQRKNEFL